MVKSEQGRELGQEWFGRLQEEIADAPAVGLRDFLAAVKSDEMGFAGQEGIDDEDK